MPLYLDEIYLNATPPDNAKKVIALVQEALKGGLPQGVTLKAGPWASNEEPKVILVLDIGILFEMCTMIAASRRRSNAGFG